MSNEKIINKRILGFIICLFIMLSFSLFWVMWNEIVLAIVCVIISLLQISFIIITPYCYIFSEECLTIKYCFGLQENIPWQYVRAIVKVTKMRLSILHLIHIKFFITVKKNCHFLCRV